MIARAIHQQSPECDRPFQVIDCTTVPEGLMESELFGHVRGAFTGAIADKPGLIELANGGSVFLDEIGELPFSFKRNSCASLRKARCVPWAAPEFAGSDMRFIAATNRNLEARVREGTFRKDLYYRLAVVSIRASRSASVARIFPLSHAICSAGWFNPWARRSAILTKRLWGSWCPIPGPGMGANSAMSWNGWSCSRPATSFGREMSEACFRRVRPRVSPQSTRV